jgi:hypothetical protein
MNRLLLVSGFSFRENKELFRFRFSGLAASAEKSCMLFLLRAKTWLLGLYEEKSRLRE